MLNQPIVEFPIKSSISSFLGNMQRSNSSGSVLAWGRAGAALYPGGSPGYIPSPPSLILPAWSLEAFALAPSALRCQPS